MLTSHTPFQLIFGMRMWIRDNAMGNMLLPEAAAKLDARSLSQTVVAQKFESPDQQGKLVADGCACFVYLHSKDESAMSSLNCLHRSDEFPLTGDAHRQRIPRRAGSHPHTDPDAFPRDE